MRTIGQTSLYVDNYFDMGQHYFYLNKINNKIFPWPAEKKTTNKYKKMSASRRCPPTRLLKNVFTTFVPTHTH